MYSYLYLILMTVINIAERSCVKSFVFEVILVRIKSECEKIRTRITPNTNNFYPDLGTHFQKTHSFFSIGTNMPQI